MSEPSRQPNENDAVEAVLQSMSGLAAEDARMAYQAYRDKRIGLASLAGFEDEEMNAMYGRALESLRLGLMRKAIDEFITLIALEPKEARYLRGLGLCYQHQRLWGWADTAYAYALEHDPDDGAALALAAECALYLSGKQQAHAQLTQVVQRGVRRPYEAPYIQRAKDILAKIRL
jgi:predicted Zn-dependent protease